MLCFFNEKLGINKANHMKKLTLTLLLLLFLFSFLSAQIRIKMKKENGIYTTPCTVNGLRLSFIFDTGASTVSLSSIEAAFMLKNGYLDEADVHGSSSSQIANGEIVKNTIVTIRKLEIGGIMLHNVEAVIVHNLSAPLLLGQSAIQKLGKIQLDGDELVIINAHSSSSDDAYAEAQELVKKADKYFDDELYALAADTYQKAYDLWSTMPDKLRKVYDNLLGTGKVSQSDLGDYEYFKKNLADEKTRRIFYNSLNKRGITADQIGDYDTFDSTLNVYLSTSQPNIQAKTLSNYCFLILNMGESYYHSKQYKLAIKYLKKAVSCIPDSSGLTIAYQYLGDSYDELGSFELAILNIQKSLSYATYDIDKQIGYFDLGWICDDLKRYDEGVDYYKKSAMYRLKHLSATTNDVMKGDVKDGVLGEVYWNISTYYAHLNQQKKSDNYRIKSALCGDEHAIEFCKKYGLKYELYLSR